MAVIFYSSSLSNPAPQLTGLVWDKLLHTAGYALLGFLYARALSGEGLALKATIGGAVVLTSLYGASDEFHQSFTPMRTMAVTDWFADSVGGAIGGILWAVSTALRPRRPPQR
jgi:VanZ family protein